MSYHDICLRGLKYCGLSRIPKEGWSTLSERLGQAINSRTYCKTDLQSSSAVTISEVLTSYFLLYCLLLNGKNADWVIFPASCFYLRVFCVESGWGKVTCFWAVVCEWHASIHSRRWEGHERPRPFSLKNPGPPAHPSQLKLTPAKMGEQKRKTGTAHYAMDYPWFNMATMNRVLLLKPRHFFSVSKAVSFSKFLMLNQNLNFSRE